MLTEIRDRSSGWFAWVIAALIIIPMAFWGVQEYATTDADVALAEIGDKKITQSQFELELSNQQQRMRQMMREQVDNNYLNSSAFKQSVLNQMVSRAAIEDVASQENYRIGDELLAAEIKDSPNFQVDGRFDPQAYANYVQSSSFSKTRYETALRGDKVVRQVTSGYQESALVLPSDVRAILEMQAEKRSFDLITLSRSEFLEAVTIDDTEVNDYYQANQDSFLATEKVSVDYLQLGIDGISEAIEVDEDSLQALYNENLESNPDSYKTDETRTVRHILLKLDDNDDEQLAKANDLISQLNAGADFAELAKEHSNDPGSAAKGGSLGVVSLGQMVPEFEESAFSLAKDEISAPIKSQFGYHIIQVQSIIGGVEKSFADVKDSLLQQERSRLAEQALIEKVELLRDLVYEQPDSLDEAAEELGLTVKTTEFFERGSGVNIAASQLVRDAAFSDEVLVEENNSEPIEVTPGNYVVIRKAVHQPSKVKDLETVKEQIVQILTNEKATQQAQNKAEELLDMARSDWATLAADETLKITTQTVSLADTQRGAVPASALKEMSAMQLVDNKPAVRSVDGANGDVYIIRLTDIQAGDVNSLSEQIKDSTRQAVAQRNGQALLASYIESLTESVNSTINTDLLEN